MELERKIVRVTIRRLRKALKKFQSDMEAEKQLKSELCQAAFVSGSVRKQSSQQIEACWAALPIGQRDPHRRPWKKFTSAPEDSTAIILNGHIEELLEESVLQEEPTLLSWIEKGIRELQSKENPALKDQVYILFCSSCFFATLLCSPYPLFLVTARNIILGYRKFRINALGKVTVSAEGGVKTF
jgi:hypothetical protein